ncbi:hypothetical protein IRJ41_023638 [Triplophysa rosa]|uniref:Secreted protein n=1 Tax=Triplophysa rosa TaxID=992332 RepID=A0A9W8CCG8_TRIRA|nr:hypothetical protein IRJ41_023638 [Triplophysa rosa]
MTAERGCVKALLWGLWLWVAAVERLTRHCGRLHFPESSRQENRTCNLTQTGNGVRLNVLKCSLSSEVFPGAVQLKIKGPKAGYYIFQKHLFEL